MTHYKYLITIIILTVIYIYCVYYSHILLQKIGELQLLESKFTSELIKIQNLNKKFTSLETNYNKYCYSYIIDSLSPLEEDFHVYNNSINYLFNISEEKFKNLKE